MKHPLKRRLAARKSIALLTGSHASLGLANRRVDFEGYQTKTAVSATPNSEIASLTKYIKGLGYSREQAAYAAKIFVSETGSTLKDRTK